MRSLRHCFTTWCAEQLDKPCLMGARGPEAFDCSGLVVCGYHAVGLADWRHTHWAQRLWDELPAVAVPQLGDLGFYGPDAQHVEHVVVMVVKGHCISADGATKHITSMDEAVKQGCRVRAHLSVHYRSDIPFLGYRASPLEVEDESEVITKPNLIALKE